MLPYAFHYVVPVTVYLTCVICVDIVRADRITDGSHTPDLANLSTIQNRSDLIITRETPSSNTVSLNETGEWLDGYQTESKKKSNLNLAFLPGLAILFLFIFVFFRACKWYRDSSKIKERGCSYDVASYVILVQGDKHFNDVDVGDNYDTVNSYNSYLRSGAYETITSSKSLQYRMDSQMYETVTSYSNYLQKIEKENNLEIEMKEIPSDASPSPKRTHFMKKNAKGRDTSQIKLPQESRFSIKPALDNYMRLKGTYQKSPMSPRSVLYDSEDRIDGTPRKIGSRMNITVNAAYSESFLQSASKRKFGRQTSTESHRSSPVRDVANVVKLANRRRTVSEDTSRLTELITRDDINKKKCNKMKNDSSLTFTEERTEFIQNNVCDKLVRMVDAETQSDISTSPSSSYKRRGRSMSQRCDTAHDSHADYAVTKIEHATSDSTAVDQDPERHIGDLPVPVILDDLKDDLSPAKVKPTAFTVCAVVHNVDAVSYPSQSGNVHDNNPQTNRDSETENQMKKQDVKNNDDSICCQSNGSIYHTNGTDDILIENERHHSSVSYGEYLEGRDYRESGCQKVNGTSLPCMSMLSSEGPMFEKHCQLNHGKGNMSHCIARRRSFHIMSKSNHENAVEIQNELSQVQGTFIEMVH
ncbi:uncharacterized protein LOC110463968 [Mizuhopecten yessoensis]|uniref:Uncharacterized protein n=1 Tax=Mizuhopecten yessoensis TaxID=6573 RepID=A0A210R285_MIZYE|nr:uncharacterized protein LOC110463968 [Mizuhopecten yessoensis]XP_021374624.1 uncharacterized protein LOC110463968 [Mizuhopecten yessoensis]XP_021374632.1 uncharacterized protein LOC110463968 [Mizuhopecten yessoensis]XP_021374641.1 uncharacterized protein LOC110463968 [Mizuhopecten yessoensis]OWF55109.1 hypothetical protein KP79_PYT15747 [Mizuhopecten yessoensis]